MVLRFSGGVFIVSVMRKPKLTYANVMSTIAVFMAMGGVSYAVTALPVNSVGTTQIKDKAVTSAKIDPSLVSLFKGQTGATGPQGPKGETTGPQVRMIVWKPPRVGIQIAVLSGSSYLDGVAYLPNTAEFDFKSSIVNCDFEFPNWSAAGSPITQVTGFDLVENKVTISAQPPNNFPAVNAIKETCWPTPA